MSKEQSQRQRPAGIRTQHVGKHGLRLPGMVTLTFDVDELENASPTSRPSRAGCA